MEERKKSVAEVAQHLREIEDYNLALRLQEEEFSSHYNRNREGRRLVGDDTKQSIIEQAHEDEAARRRRLEALKKMFVNEFLVYVCIAYGFKYCHLRTETDEEIARRLQLEFEQEEKRRLEEVARRDAELAQRLAQIEGQSTSSVSSNTVPSYQVQTSPGGRIQPPPLIDLSEDVSITNPINAEPNQPRVLQPASTGPIPGPPTGYGGPAATEAPRQAEPISLHPTNPFLQDLPVQQSSRSTPYYSEFGLPPPSDLALGKRN
ncbi:hypothetical protein ANCCAN_09287 [Ancylostoma caninum]|uniref:Coiled-coil domain-containing protein n=1 Tax=Ancylostoma caninum TaxID=29170 RepID=A0A368GK09_ANCCA|nr:hypothetical protein ANCCAN_09287 [Ancylostoma caninum]